MGPQVDAWVQVACPRLSVDWGHFFDRPVLTSYELEVAMGQQEWRVRGLVWSDRAAETRFFSGLTRKMHE